MDEFAFIDWIRSITRLDPQAVPVGPGDDCAVLRVGQEQLLVTTDQCADGVHFILSECGPEQAGYKVMARNLSDIAAMAGEPLAAVATVALPRGMPTEHAKSIYLGLRRAGDAFHCPVVGGDVMAWNNPLLLTVTLLGRPVGKAPILRSGAKVGDAICVTGTLGGSVASGKHLRFIPRLAEASRLVQRYPLHAMIDLSDGLASDLRHICKESRAGAQLLSQSIPLSPAAQTQSDPLTSALTDGEDYELLFTLPADAADGMLADQPLDVAVTRIGTITADPAITLLDPAGLPHPLDGSGFRHST